MRSFVPAVAVTLLATATIAPAQDFGPGSWGVTMGQGNLMTQALDAPLRRQGRAAGEGSRGLGQALTRPVLPAPAARLDVTYRADPAVRRQVVDRYLAWARGLDPAGADRLAGELERQDFVDVWRRIVAGDGLKTGDAADAFVGYLVLNWTMADGEAREGPRGTLAVAGQVRAAMATLPLFAQMTEAERQAFAETLMLNFIMQQAAFVGALRAGNRAMQARLGEAAQRRFLTELGLDLRAHELSAKGLVPR
jgi:hypothetical protein